jgi:hypothetical protein
LFVAGLDSAIHVFVLDRRRNKTWMPATSVGMTFKSNFDAPHRAAPTSAIEIAGT